MSGSSDLFNRVIPEHRWIAVRKHQWKPQRWLPVDDDGRSQRDSLGEIQNVGNVHPQAAVAGGSSYGSILLRGNAMEANAIASTEPDKATA
jgi:hypothetical protein